MVWVGYHVLNNLRETLKPALEKIGKGFASTGLSPNFWTSVGLGFALLSAVVYGLGIEFGLIIGGVLLFPALCELLFSVLYVSLFVSCMSGSIVCSYLPKHKDITIIDASMLIGRICLYIYKER